MKMALLALTRGGKKLALRLRDKLEKNDHKVDVFITKKLANNDEDIKTFTSLRKITADIFSKYEGLIFIMALGIVVRMIATYIKDKRNDPAVVVLDEKGRNAISVLSGHIGGANSLSEEIAKSIKARAVITTATDVNNKLAFDLLAKELNFKIFPFENLKYANSALVNDKSINIYSDYQLDKLNKVIQKKLAVKLKGTNINLFYIGDKNLKEVQELIKVRNQKYEYFPVIISNRKINSKIKMERKFLQLLPINIIIGLGSRKGVAKKQVKTAVKCALNTLQLKKESIKKFATIDLKKDEQGIKNYVKELNSSLEIISRKEIKNSNIEFTKSEFVKKKIGVGGACEPAAILAAKKGKLIMKKKAVNKVTVAVVEENFI